ncbi:hypothetical protein [Paenibacillus sp. NRS-1760]|uniref:hypothetical protein n=1 Tax=Paenibacillus sp. NRS-1760 TaxID=3233902 RepID=UPI003D26CF7F
MAKRTKKEVGMHERELGTSELASIIGKTPQWVRQLTRDGVLKQVARGKYILNDAVQAYIEHASGGKEDDGKPRLVDHKTEHERIKVEKASLELAQMRGELHAAEDVESVMTDMLITLRSRLLGLPTKIGPRLQYVQDLSVLTDIITDEIRIALSSLSEYDPELFKGGGEDEPIQKEN